MDIYVCQHITSEHLYYNVYYFYLTKQLKMGYCSELTNVWKAVRDIDSIIGNISLEGIITIICCVLSNIGLLIRLSLQNIVPFYKSYPGKVSILTRHNRSLRNVVCVM